MVFPKQQAPRPVAGPSGALTPPSSPWFPLIAAVLAAAALGALAISPQSLWIDELGTWRLTRADDLTTWLAQLLGWRNSDAQLPLYHAWIKLWSGLFGSQEAVLRCSNLPWLALALWPLWRAPVRPDAVALLRGIGGVLLLHPLVWYYTNELRPYVMLLAGATLAGTGLMGAWMESDDARERALSRHLLIAGLAMLAASSAIGAIWTLAFLLPALWLAGRRHGPGLGLSRGHALTIVLSLAVLVPVFAQYLSSFLSGVTATTLHQHKLVNFGYAFYELLGLAGVGPGREALRVAPVAALREQAPALAAAALLLLAGLGLGLRALWQRDGGRALAVLLLALLPVLVLLGLAELKHWRVVGRHMVPLLFFVALVLAAAGQAAWQGGGWASRALVAGALLALLASSVSIRLAERHQREQYREAAAAAQQSLAQGRTTWWFADSAGPEYHGLGPHTYKLVPQVDYDRGLKHLYDGLASRLVTDCRQVPAGSLLVLENPSADDLAACPPPGRVIYSRRDTFDVAGQGEAWLRQHGLAPQRRLIGFEIWQ